MGCRHLENLYVVRHGGICACPDALGYLLAGTVRPLGMVSVRF
jgi:hypothetical protein